MVSKFLKNVVGDEVIPNFVFFCLFAKGQNSEAEGNNNYGVLRQRFY